MQGLRRHRLLLPGSALIAAMPVLFGVIRAVSTGDDFRYLWLAAAALLGTTAVMTIGPTPAAGRIGLRAVAAVAAGALCAATAALLQGARAGPGVAIVAVAFGLCTGIGGTLASLARQSRLT